MLLTITTTYRPATDIGYLLGKHPERVQTFRVKHGQAHVFYPEVAVDRCTVALLLEIDPLALSGQRRDGATFVLQPYVNDRPYVASSFLAVAIGTLFRSAMRQRTDEWAALAAEPIPLQAELAALPVRGGAELVHALFEPLGYAVQTTTHPLDPAFPDWGDSRILTVALSHTVTLRELLQHLTVLIPVLDDEKHYWVGRDEVEKLLQRGADWLKTHPSRQLISRRYLRHQRHLTRAALAQLADAESTEPEPSTVDLVEVDGEKAIGLHKQRHIAVRDALLAAGARTVLDLGCGEGRLLRLLQREASFETLVGVDASHRALDNAAERLRLPRFRLQDRAKAEVDGVEPPRIRLLHGSLTYVDSRLAGFDAAALVEVIEHIETERLPSFERMLFQHARPRTVVLTTPNREYNQMWPSLPAGRLRHRDHRFEWTRDEFAAWCARIGRSYGYSVSIAPIGPIDDTVGAPSQMVVFERA